MEKWLSKVEDTFIKVVLCKNVTFRKVATERKT
jgi:hypothetical protein